MNKRFNEWLKILIQDLNTIKKAIFGENMCTQIKYHYAIINKPNYLTRKSNGVLNT